MIGNQCQLELVSDVHHIVSRNSRSARRNVQHETFVLRHPVVERNPSRPLIQLPSWFARDLGPWFNNGHQRPRGVGLDRGRFGGRRSKAAKLPVIS
jgi:hypothetical protein